MNFAELKALLFARSNFGVKLGLERMREACALLGEALETYTRIGMPRHIEIARNLLTS